MCFFLRVLVQILAPAYVMLKPDWQWTGQSNTVYGSYDHTKAYDGDVSTFFHSNGPSGHAFEWLEINFGRVVSVSFENSL